MNRNLLILCSMIAGVVVFPLTANATTFTWDGGGGANTNWDLSANWAGDPAMPSFSADNNQIDMVFGNTYTSTTVTLSDLDKIRSVTIAADAPAYTFEDDLASGYARMYFRGLKITAPITSPGSVFFTNASSNQQKINCMFLARGETGTANGYLGINLNNEIMDGGVEIPNLWVASDMVFTQITKIIGPGDVQIDGNFTISTTSEMSVDTNTNVVVAGGLAKQGAVTTNTTFRKLGSGTIVLNGASPITNDPYPTGISGAVYSNYEHVTVIGDSDANISGTGVTDIGAIRVSNGGALGVVGTSSASYLQIRGSHESNGRLELAGGISLEKYIKMNGHGGDNSLNAAIVNTSGDNTLAGTIDFETDAREYNIDSASGLLTVNSAIVNDCDGVRHLNLGGDGNGAINSDLTASTGADPDYSVTKRNSGTWTLNGSGNAYNGATTVSGGTLKLGALASIVTSPLIDVQADSFFDVTAQTGGFALAGTQTLKGKGTVVGDVVAASGSQVKPGESIGVLTIDGDVTLGGTLEVEYDGGASPAIDVLAVTGDLVLDSGMSFDFLGVPETLTDSSYTFVTFTPGGLTGTAVANNVPEGYEVQYDNLGGKIALVVIPEPSTLLLLVMAGLGLAVYTRNRR